MHQTPVTNRNSLNYFILNYQLLSTTIDPPVSAYLFQTTCVLIKLSVSISTKKEQIDPQTKNKF